MFLFLSLAFFKLLNRVGQINLAVHNSTVEDYRYVNLPENLFRFRSDESVLDGTWDTTSKHLLIALKFTLFLDKLINAYEYCRQNLKVSLKQSTIFKNKVNFNKSKIITVSFMNILGN